MSLNEVRNLFHEFLELAVDRLHLSRNPIYDTATFSPQPYQLDYKGRDHVFIHNNTNAAVTITSSDNLFQISVPANGWVSIGAPQSTVFTTAAAQRFPIICTDKDIQ